MLSSGEDANVCNIHTGLSLLAMRIIKFGWNLLDFCYLSDEVFGEDLPIPAATKMFPANIEDPFVRADILVQTFREISAVSVSTQDNQNRQTLLQNIEKNFHLMSKLKNLQSTGKIFHWFVIFLRKRVVCLCCWLIYCRCWCINLLLHFSV